MRILIGAAILACVAAIHAEPTSAQTEDSRSGPEYIRAEHMIAAFEAIGAQVTRADETNSYTVTLASGGTVDAQLQNCTDKSRGYQCRTLSVIAQFDPPENRTEVEVLEAVNKHNRTDIFGRAFVSSDGRIVLRFAFINTGNESLMAMVHRLMNWERGLITFHGYLERARSEN